MSHLRAHESVFEGFRALTVENDLISCTMLPELGGKLSSLRDLRTGREWLWRNDCIPYRRDFNSSSYVREADTGGWDECFPTVAPCLYPQEPWQGVEIPDHGELWMQPWETELSAEPHDASIVVRARVPGNKLPYVFERAITLVADAATLRFDYTLRSQTQAPLSFIWSAHPIFAIEPGMRIMLPDDARMRVYSCLPADLLNDEQTYIWPLEITASGQRLNLAEAPSMRAGIACKLWSEPLTQGWAELVAQDGSVRFRFDPALLPQVGIWLNAGGWSGIGGTPYYNLGLEPCIGAQDSLWDAVEREQRYGILAPTGIRTWWLEVALGAS